MLADGLVREVKALLAAGYSPELPTFSAIGYQEIIQYLQGEIPLDDAIELIKRNTRVFVRRQANWFKPDDPRITWFLASKSLVDQMESTIRRKLNEH
jgi:tRNA dimethylallyltransferase